MALKKMLFYHDNAQFFLHTSRIVREKMDDLNLQTQAVSRIKEI